jgi:predicted nucleic acid-binding protein
VRIYLDNCCLGRPFDDDCQDRVRLEADAVLLILEHVRAKEFVWVGSEVLSEESRRNPDLEKRRRVDAYLDLVTLKVEITPLDVERARSFQRLGFDVFDSYHLAAAVRGNCDVFLTTDDRLLRRARHQAARLGVRVENPIDWLREVRPDENA